MRGSGLTEAWRLAVSPLLQQCDRRVTRFAACPGPACEWRLPVQLHPRFDNRRIVADHGAAGGVGPAAGHVDVVQRQLGVAAPVPVDAHGPGLHAAAADGAVVEVELVVAKPELPEP